jgi:hypothetical protein
MWATNWFGHRSASVTEVPIVNESPRATYRSGAAAGDPRLEGDEGADGSEADGVTD